MKLSRLGIGDWLIGIGSLALVIVLFAQPWFGYHANFARAAGELGVTVSANGWQTFTVVGPLALLTGLLGILTFVFQLTRSSPALGILTTIVLAPFALANLIVLILKVLIFPPSLNLGALGSSGNDLTGKPGAYEAVVLALLIAMGVWISLRREGVAESDTPQQIEVFQLP